MEQIANSINTSSDEIAAAKTSALERSLPVIATIWFFKVLNSYLVWTSLAPVVHILSALLILWGTFLLSDKLSSSKYNRILFLSILIYFFWILMTKSISFGYVVKLSTDYIPFLCIVLWPSELLIKTYRIIRTVIVFFAIGAAILSVLILMGLHERIPHLVLPAREALHVKNGTFYHLYIFLITDCKVMGVSPRACGMLQEPGHFAILLGFIYLIDRLSGQKLNYGIVICGLLTFSSTFVLMVVFAEIHHLLSWRGVRKVVLYVLILLLFLMVLYFFLPTGLQDQIYHYAYGRNLENVVETLNETASLTDALDERASFISIVNYEKMSSLQYIFGGGHKDAGYALSDYRGMILSIGIFGMILAIIMYLSILVNTPFKLKIALGLAFFLVIIHRSWMLYAPYIFFEAFMAVIVFRLSQRKEHNYKIL